MCIQSLKKVLGKYTFYKDLNIASGLIVWMNALVNPICYFIQLKDVRAHMIHVMVCGRRAGKSGEDINISHEFQSVSSMRSGSVNSSNGLRVDDRKSVTTVC